MNTKNITAAVDDLRKVKEDSGLQQHAEEVYALALEGLKRWQDSHVETVQAFRTIKIEGLYRFLMMPSGEPFPAFVPFLKATFKRETEGWDKGLRNMWAVSLADLGLSDRDVADVLGISHTTVQRARKEADRAAQGDDTGQQGETRKSEGSKTPSDKLIASLKAFIVGCPDQSEWPTAGVVNVLAVMDDAMDAARRQLARREHQKVTSKGTNARTGTTVAAAADKAGIPVTPATPPAKAAAKKAAGV